MAVVFCDGCDSYTATADILYKWDINSGWVYNATSGRNGGGGLRSVTGVGALTTRLASMAVTEHCQAMWFKASTAPAGTVDFITPQTSANVSLNKLRITSSGLLTLANASNSAIAGPGTRNICDNQWHWIEVRMKHAGGVSGYSAYIDTVLDFSNFTVSGSSGTVDHIVINGLLAATVDIDDFMVWEDTAGGPQLASIPLGPRQITTLRPNGDNTQAFTRSTGSTNYNLVNEQASDGDTSYVQDGTSGDQDLYEYATFATDPATITAVMLNSMLMNPNPGTINFQNVCKSTSTSLGTSTITPSAYSIKQTSFPTDPNTGSAWTPNNLAAAQFGIKVA